MGHVFGRAALMTRFRGALDAALSPQTLLHRLQAVFVALKAWLAHVCYSRGETRFFVSLDVPRYMLAGNNSRSAIVREKMEFNINEDR